MPENRFFSEAPLAAPGECVFLQDAEHHHLFRVMRLEVGDAVELVNGKGALAEAKIEKIGKNQTELTVKTASLAPLPQKSLSLAVPLMRSAKLEWVLEKGTEIGADRFLLFPAERGERDALKENHRARLFAIRVAALKQSGRLFLPSIEEFSSLAALLATVDGLYFGDPEAPPSHDWGKGELTVLFATGPERGFSPEEYAHLAQKGKGVRLSPYVLRAETAPLVAAAQAMCALSRHGSV